MISRRTTLLGLGACVAGCGRREPPPGAVASDAVAVASAPPPAPSASSEARPPDVDVATREIAFTDADGGPQHCVLVTAKPPGAGRLPLLVALHGLGESKKGLSGGAWGWVRDYWLDRALRRLSAPPLVAEDFLGFVTRSRLAQLNAQLAKQPFSGLAIACLYTPDLLNPRSLDNARAFGRFVVEHALPRLRREPDVDGSRTGIDGVSLGGRLSLLVGLAHPKEFQSIGSLQAALQLSEARELARRAKAAVLENPALALRLVTSERDFYKDEIGAFHEALAKVGVSHEHDVLPGPHDYPWNRGPGAIEMCLFADRAARAR